MVSRTSRKKNKGRDRKAKKMETERARVRNWWLGWAQGEDKVTGKKRQCSHGCSAIPNDLEHPVSKFLNDFISYWDSCDTGKRTVVMIMRDTLKKHPQVWNNDGYKKTAMNILISMGTNMLLSSEQEVNEDTGSAWAIRLTKTIVILDHYCDSFSYGAVINSRGVASKLRDLDGLRYSSGRRDALKFFSKRGSCSCLKAMHQDARRTVLKTGQCAGCKKEKERVTLSVCSRCMIAHFCSRECQVAYWPKHEKYCDKYVRTQVQAEDDEDDGTEE